MRRNILIILGVAIAAAALGGGASIALGAFGDGPTEKVSLEAVAFETDAFQEDALADGVVTRDEFLGAAENAAACMRSKGLAARVEAEEQSAAIVTDGPGDHQIGAACMARHLDRVALTWASAHKPTDAGRSQALADVQACYERAGGDVGLTWLELKQVMRDGADAEALRVFECLQASIDKYGFSP